MPNPGWWENAYDKMRGLDPLPSSQLAPDVVPPPGTPREWKGVKNTLGQRLMDMAQDPRNAWIGMGPMAGVIKGAKGAKAVNDIRMQHFKEKAAGMNRPSKDFTFDQYMEMYPTREAAIERWGDIPEAEMRKAYKEFLKQQKLENEAKIMRLRESMKSGE